jgi:hypothetical protein
VPKPPASAHEDKDADPEDTDADPQPGRVVLYRSVAIKRARLLIGLAFAVATLVLAVPVVSSQKPVPPPTGLFVGLNTNDDLPTTHPASTLYVAIRASGCRNPVTVEGYLDRPESSWKLDKRVGVARHGIRGPTHAEVVLAGADIEGVDAGLAGGEDIRGAFEASEISGAGVVFSGPTEWPVHNRLVRYLGSAKSPKHPLGAAVLIAPQWPKVRVPLHFTFTADMVHPFGFHRCYVDVPALFGSGGGIDNRSLHEAEEFTMTPGSAGEEPSPGITQIPGFPNVREVARAEVSVLVAGHVVDGASLGSGATTIPNGAHYSCSTEGVRSPAQTNETCAGDPVFEVQGTDYEITRRLFAAGIFGAIAATLIIEALFIAKAPRRS